MFPEMCPVTEGMKDVAKIPLITGNGDSALGSSPNDIRDKGWKVSTKNEDGSNPSVTLGFTKKDTTETAPLVVDIVVLVRISFHYYCTSFECMMFILYK